MRVCQACETENPAGALQCVACGVALGPDIVGDEVRRFATVVQSDLKGSTALGEKLDAESLREVLTRYFDEMRFVYESHGGTIEKIIGDAIVAVFGVPTPRIRRCGPGGRGRGREPVGARRPQRRVRADVGRSARRPDRREHRRRRGRRGAGRTARPDRRHHADLVGHGAERAAARDPDLRVDLCAGAGPDRGRGHAAGDAEGHGRRDPGLSSRRGPSDGRRSPTCGSGGEGGAMRTTSARAARPSRWYSPIRSRRR